MAAKAWQEVIRTVTAACGAKCNPNVQRWAAILTARLRRAEYIALNFIAYGIAQDLAQGLKQAEPRRPIAEDYASQLMKYAESAVALEEGERDSMLDTAAFVTIVSQADRKERDQKAVKDAVNKLATLVARAEHWVIENQLHWVLDVHFADDDTHHTSPRFCLLMFDVHKPLQPVHKIFRTLRGSCIGAIFRT